MEAPRELGRIVEQGVDVSLLHHRIQVTMKRQLDVQLAMPLCNLINLSQSMQIPLLGQQVITDPTVTMAREKSPATSFVTHQTAQAMGSYSSVQFCGIPQGKGPHTVGCTDLMTDHTIQVNRSVVAGELSHRQLSSDQRCRGPWVTRVNIGSLAVCFPHSVTAGRKVKVKAQPLCSAFTLRPAVTVREADGKGPDRHQNGSFLRLFYPCVDSDEYEEAVWIPRREYYLGIADMLKLNRTVMDAIFSYYFGSVKCPAKMNAPFHPGEKYPLVIFSHGLGAFRTLYSTICIALASQGFVVAAVEHRDESASATFYFRESSSADTCQGDEEHECMEEVWLYKKTPKPGADEFPLRYEQVQKRADECLRALDLMLDINAGKPVTNALPSNFDWSLLKDSIDVQKLAIAGHSFGAATAIKALGRDSRFRCGVALDSWMFPLRDEIFSTIHQPVLFVNSEKFQWVDNILLMKKMDSTSVQRKMITIK
ncbi:unnamed protein product [Ranitomeya imitator]|uniref:Platelet-activating factor acetylhydrolase n=1 Tax=Ranitomeya imitator TaxID=111125 RepID=A0ABN9KSC0_9NEOB|nr:unnamed protein product [Ranitomeya imitator]